MKLTIAGQTEAGGDAAVAIGVLHRTYPDAPLAEDANWLNVSIEATLPGYHAAFEGRVRAEDFPEFLYDLAQMHETGRGSAAFCTVEEIVELRCGRDDSGRIQWSGLTTHPAGSGAVLSFEFSSDHKVLPELIAALEATCKKFPVIG